MKINKKLFYTFLSIGAISVLPLTAISCSNDYNDVSNQKFDKFYMIKRGRVYYISSVNGLPRTTAQLDSKIKINNQIATYLNDYVKKTQQQKIKYTITNPNLLLIDKDLITGYDKEINLKLNGLLFTLKISNDSPTFSNLDTSKDYFKPRDKGTTGEIQNVTNNYGISYNLFYKNTLVASIPQISTTLTKIKDVKPSFLEEQEKITPDYVTKTFSKNFKPFDFDFNNPSSPYYNNSFEAKVVSVADGDTITVQPLSTKNINGVFNVSPSDNISIRLSGIDTPEKAVGRGDTAQTSSLFEYDFAYMSTKFAKALFPEGTTVMIAFAGNKDSWGRIVADVFFRLNNQGNYKYSYSTEITRAGYTLPFGEDGYSEDLKNDNSNHSFMRMVYPAIADAMYQAQKEKVGYYEYFQTFNNISNYVYGLKRNTKYIVFENVYKINHEK